MTSGRTYQLTITSNSRKGYKITATLSGVSLATCRGMIGPNIERWWSAQGRSSLKRREKENCRITSVCWQATIY